jgi:transcriptional regulator with XRE-family HTH domain
MSLAQRVRDIRYAKGWGPDELASRAAISRTALYQIENGKTGLPRAGTLRRIAVALEVPMEDLLPGFEDEAGSTATHSDGPGLRRHRSLYDWVPSEGGALTMPRAAGVKAASIASVDESRFAVDAGLPIKNNEHEWIFLREGELMSKLHDLLHSPIGESVAQILEELHAVLPRSRSSI